MSPTIIALSIGMLAMLVVALLAWLVIKMPQGTPEMMETAKSIEIGANAFIKRMYKTIVMVSSCILIPLAIFFKDIVILGSFVFGITLSLLSGYIGMRIAVKANVRTAYAAKTSVERAFLVAFRGGGVTGLTVISLSLIGVSILILLFNDPNRIVSFGFGASLAALFAQLGGGIFTKGADIGADLVGKIEHRIPEDDPRNPAVIADLVGDNVGDCAGRGSDLFESISDDYVTAMILGSLMMGSYGLKALMFPLMLGASGIIATMIGIFMARYWRRSAPLASFNIILAAAVVICSVGAYISTMVFLGDVSVFIAILSGLIASISVGFIVQYYMGSNSKAIREIVASSDHGTAMNIITGLAYGLQSPFMPLLLVVSTTIFAYYITGGSFIGIIGANLGTDLATGIIMSSDTFGPISDNAAGISRMSGMAPQLSETLDSLDTLGNTTKAYTKAFASASSVFSTIVLFGTYSELSGLSRLNVSFLNPIIIIGFLLGGGFCFLFSSMALSATAKTAYKMVEEVRQQFKERPRIMVGTEKPDYARCVDIATKDSLKRMTWPALLAITAPIIIGVLLGKYALGAMLLGGFSTSTLLASFFNFGGGMWDNAKKRIETQFWLKGSPIHAAGVTGDTVGDPLKDVAGPSLNIFMKLINMTALLILPLLNIL
ncbi:sodium-translocating pyrophosphatase [Candidatus Bathyarchaeota archaeon]|nr:sodium-translocating pyrophosphatase [Candidatus Bathyarchaeota archaeon]MBS7631000.1 sodium-translocating pyrophosphatase [Candidatus Bathyarchaeota archaeon]